jgi:hypothetical protein
LEEKKITQALAESKEKITTLSTEAARTHFSDLTKLQLLAQELHDMSAPTGRIEAQLTEARTRGTKAMDTLMSIIVPTLARDTPANVPRPSVVPSAIPTAPKSLDEAVIAKAKALQLRSSNQGWGNIQKL